MWACASIQIDFFVQDFIGFGNADLAVKLIHAECKNI